jgi:hypothetical protein
MHEARRVQFPGDQIARLDELIIPLVTVRAPGLLSLYGVGPDTAPCCVGPWCVWLPCCQSCSWWSLRG